MTPQRFLLDDAFISMLRTDYIALSDSEKLNNLAGYYVDYMGRMQDLLSPTDNLIVGRRGTGKTTLLYRGLVECMRSWEGDESNKARPRTLAIYMDLGKTLGDKKLAERDFELFEQAFAQELFNSIQTELCRAWPQLGDDPGLFDRIFHRTNTRKVTEAKAALSALANVLENGAKRFTQIGGEQSFTRSSEVQTEKKKRAAGKLSHKDIEFDGGVEARNQSSFREEVSGRETVHVVTTTSDILRGLGSIRRAANVSHIVLLFDEYSDLDTATQRQFSSILKRILGNEHGIHVKICAITDHFTLGSSIVPQRDIFQISLDLDAFVARSSSLNAALTHLETLTKTLVTQRVSSYAPEVSISDVFDRPDLLLAEVSRAAMGVPRTAGIILNSAWTRASERGDKLPRIQRSDIDYAISNTSKNYYESMAGAARDGIGIPSVVAEVFDSLIQRAQEERAKTPHVAASHFMVTPKNESLLRHLKMFFLVHLLEEDRTTKKSRANRSLYAFDYGVAVENNLGWTTEKNTIRQQRFAYDDVISAYLEDSSVPRSSARCGLCDSEYSDNDLRLPNGMIMRYCPQDGSALDRLPSSFDRFTEEEVKIIGFIRSASRDKGVEARAVADTIGCYVQKVAKFGEKLEREGVIARDDSSKPMRYFDNDNAEPSAR